MIGNKRYKVGLLLLILFLCPILRKFSEIDWKIILTVVALWLAAKKNKLVLILVIPALFLINLNLNHFFTMNLKPFEYSFDLEKMVITNPKNIEMIQTYWKNDVVIPYRLRNIFYSNWLVLRLWVSNILRIISPVYLLRTLGVVGVLTLFGAKPRRQEIFWILTVAASSALGILVDTGTSLVLILPALIFWWWRSLNHEK